MTRTLGDRRATIRFDVAGEVWGSVETLEPVPIRNIGRGGMLVEAPQPLKPDQVLRIHILLPAHESIVEGQVRHVTTLGGATAGNRYLIGFKFVAIETNTSEYIDRLVAASDHPGSEGATN